MRNFRAYIGYIFSLCLIPVSVFAFFRSKFNLFYETDYISFYITLSAALFFVISITLCWHYSFLFIRNKALLYVNRFFRNALDIDSDKVSFEDIKSIREKFILDMREKEIGSIALFSCFIPFFLCFAAATIMLAILDYRFLYSLAISVFIIFILMYFSYALINLCDIRKYANWIDLFLKTLTFASKGVQFYGAEEAMIEKFSKCKNIIKKETKETLSKISFKAFLYSCVFFCFICVLYIAKEDYVLSNLLNISSIADLFFFSLFTFMISFYSFIKYIRSKRIVIDIVGNAQIEDNPEEKKKLSGNNLFIAFHNVCFQNPTIISDKLLINNLSFSVLPGEFVAITGESSYVYAKYIFELLLKYYKLQSGAIYLSGTKLESIKKSSVRKLISIFRLDFGLISGTVYENLELASYAKEPAKIERIAGKFGLLEDLDLEIYDEKGELSISQEIIIRIQLARIYMQKPKIVLIETPDYFENEFAKTVFFDFVKNISKRKTMLILTDDIKTLVYANKVLYIGENESYFGTPAELSRVDSYGRYLSMLKRN